MQYRISAKGGEIGGYLWEVENETLQSMMTKTVSAFVTVVTGTTGLRHNLDLKRGFRSLPDAASINP